MNSIPEDQTPGQIKVTLFSHARDNQGLADTLPDWPSFVDALRDLLAERSEPDKRQLPAIGPYALRPGAGRKSEAVDALYLAALDIDRDLPSVDPLLDALRASGLASFVHTSPSDPGPDTRKVRVYVPTSRPVTQGECSLVRRALAHTLKVAVDPQSLDPSRIFFAGKIDGTAERETWETEGDPLQVDDLIALRLVPDEPTPAAAVATAPVTSRAARVAAVVLPLVAERGQRHTVARALGGYLGRYELGAWTDDEIAACVRLLPSDAVGARVRDALGTAARARGGEAAPGWKELHDMLGADAAKLECAARSEWWARACAPGGWVHRRRARNRPALRLVEPGERADDGAAPSNPQPAADEKPSDLGNARRLVRMHGADLRFCAARGVWYVWDGARWRADDTGEVQRRAKQTADSFWIDVPNAEDRKAAAAWANQSQNANRIASAIRLAETEPGIAVRVTDLDSDPWLLNVQNGTLDLRTGKLRDPDRSLLMTKCCTARYEPGARSDLWEAFITRTTGGDAELAAYIQRALGYALYGAWREKAFWFGYGPPDGAKSTCLRAIGDVLGDYHVSADPETWMIHHNVGGNRGDVVRLLGARLVTSLEVRPGLRFNQSLMKAVTGGDKIVAAAKYEGEIEFPPTFALWFGANDRPIIPDDDEGFWNRVRCVPFTNPVPPSEQDKALAEKLTGPDHAPGVLAWLVRGCLAWQASGIGACAAVEQATATYRADMNQAAGFFAECCELTGDPADEVPRRHMREAYERWCRANNVRKPLSAEALGKRLRTLGVGGDDKPRQVMRDSGLFTSEALQKFAGRDRHWTGVRLTSG